MSTDSKKTTDPETLLAAHEYATEASKNAPVLQIALFLAFQAGVTWDRRRIHDQINSTCPEYLRDFET